MINIFLSFLYVVTYKGHPVPKNIHPCDRNIDHLSLETRVKVGVGCSTINGRRIYNNGYLYDLVEGEYEQV